MVRDRMNNEIEAKPLFGLCKKMRDLYGEDVYLDSFVSSRFGSLNRLHSRLLFAEEAHR